MASEFTFTNPEAAKQAIARLQLQAALAENQSREAIERERTAAQRAVTQANINENDKNRALSREGIASQERWRSGYGSSAAANDRANTQFQTVLGEIRGSGSDPMTKRELEARLAQFPQITDDLKENLRSERDLAYRVALDAYNTGEQLAANYRTELSGKKPGDFALAGVYERIGKDNNVVFDRALGTVRSRFPKPRVDADVTQNGILGATRPGGVFPSAQEMQALSRQGSVPTIGDMKSRVTGVTAGAPIAISPAQDYGGAGVAVPQRAISPAQDYGGAAPTQSMMGYPAQPPDFMDNYRAYAAATGPVYGPPNTPVQNPYESVVARNPFGLGLMSIPAPQPVHPFMDMSQPYRQPSMYELYGPPNRAVRSTDFAPPMMNTLPRLWDMQNIRPEFRPPMDDYYYTPLQ